MVKIPSTVIKFWLIQFRKLSNRTAHRFQSLVQPSIPHLILQSNHPSKRKGKIISHTISKRSSIRIKENAFPSWSIYPKQENVIYNAQPVFQTTSFKTWKITINFIERFNNSSYEFILFDDYPSLPSPPSSKSLSDHKLKFWRKTWSLSPESLSLDLPQKRFSRRALWVQYPTIRQLVTLSPLPFAPNFPRNLRSTGKLPN